MIYVPFPRPLVTWEGEENGVPFPHTSDRTAGDHCPCGACFVSPINVHEACGRCETWFCPRCQMWCVWDVGCAGEDGLDALCDYCWAVVEDAAE